jgi:3-methyladenine DNA glycosylase/8-oxoguanine DNA glycosylase
VHVTAAQQRTFTPPHPTDLRLTLGVLSRGRWDSTMRVGRTSADGIWRATRTPDGPCTQHLVQHGDRMTMSAWGPGATWALERAPLLLGANDDDDDFVAHHELIDRAHRLHPGLRFPSTLAVWEILLPVVLEQKVTGVEARRSYGSLLRVLGELAPSAAGGPQLVLPPDPRVVADTPSHVFHSANVERKRSDTIRRAAGYAHRLEEVVTMSPSDAMARLQALPGLGIWTANEVAAVALGDADAVSVGDYHIKNWVSWALAGEARGTDERMLELLEPYRGHRGRVVRLIAASGVQPPKFGPRLTIQKRW